jgi:hypothetical protein
MGDLSFLIVLRVSVSTTEMIWRLFYKHPVAIIFYLLYLWTCISAVMEEFEYERFYAANGKWPDGLPKCGLPPFLVFAVVFFFISCAYAIAAKENKFYLWLIAGIIIPIVILIAIDKYSG